MADLSTSDHDRRWLILAVLSVAQLMVVLDATIVNIALPSAQKALNFSNGDRQWVVTAYTLGFGSLLLIGGRLSDLFGRRRTLITGLVGFAVASAVGGTAQSFNTLIGARADVFAAVAATGALLLLSRHVRTTRPRLDVSGVLTGSAGLFALVYGFNEAYTNGWGASSTMGFLAAGVALLAVFVVIQVRSTHPLLPLGIVADRNRGGSLLAMLMASIGMFGVFLFLT